MRTGVATRDGGPTTWVRAAAPFAVLLLALSACGTQVGDSASPAATSDSSVDEGGGSEPPASQTDAFDEVADFYDGNTVTIIVGSAPGGGFDTYARFIGQHIGRHIPGNPNVIVENMEGAGSLIAANHIMNVALKDGTVIGHTNGGLFVQQTLGTVEGIEYDSRDWYFLGAAARDRKICFVRAETEVTSLEQVMNPDGQRIVLGGSAPGSGSVDTPIRLEAALDLNIQLVDGYEGTGPERLAVEQGEVDGICGVGWESFAASSLDRVDSGEWNVIAQMTLEPIDHPAMEGVPMALDLAPDDRATDIIRYGIALPGDLVRPWMVSPEVPQDRAAALRQAFADLMADPEFLAEAEEANLTIDYLGGEQLGQLVTELFEMPEEIKELLREVSEADD